MVDTGGIEPAKTPGANRVTCLWLQAHINCGIEGILTNYVNQDIVG